MCYSGGVSSDLALRFDDRAIAAAKQFSTLNRESAGAWNESENSGEYVASDTLKLRTLYIPLTPVLDRIPSRSN